MTWAEAIFEACRTCHRHFRVACDRNDPEAVKEARAALAALVNGCDHVGGLAL